jgi:hypothetical protein
MRQMQAQLRAKCESAPLRRSVTERAMRSTPNACGVNAYSSDLLKKLKGAAALYRCNRYLLPRCNQASGVAGAGATGSAAPIFLR